QDVKVGRKVQAVGQDGVPVGASGHSRQRQLVKIDRRGIGQDDLAFTGPDEPGDFVADASGGLEPALAPTADEPLAPFAPDDLVQQGDCRPRQAADRVTVQVDEVGIVDYEPLAKGG